MMRQRLYNPAQLSSNELKASFIARQETLEELHRIIREEKPGRPCQHFLLIGPRGMGKTTLGLRFLLSIEEVSEFAASWQPVAFDEESYGIGDLADFWLTALDHLSRATDEPRWAEQADAIREDENDPERQAVYARAALRDFHQESGKRLILFVENLDVIFGQLGNEREVHTLRASLIERSDILLVGSANTVFDAIRGHGQPFYEFFQLFILEGLGPEDTHRMLESYADGNGTSDLPEALRRERGRLETVRRLTGGNPRLLVLACRMLIESPLGSPLEDLERLIDEQTPYFKARIEELPTQGRRVFHCLAAGWSPMLAKEVAAASKLRSSHASAQLRQLVDKGYAREIRLPSERRVRYEVSDRFYNIYYLLRFSRTGRQRLERLVHFLHDLFGRFAESEAACRNATELDPTNADAWAVLSEAILGSDDEARLAEAEACVHRAVELGPDSPAALHVLSDVSARRGNWTEAMGLLENAVSIGDGGFQTEERPGLAQSLIGLVSAGQGPRVRKLMERAGLVESMEPLWHAVRMETGEELEPLPAEIMDAVKEIRRKFEERRQTP